MLQQSAFAVKAQSHCKATSTVAKLGAGSEPSARLKNSRSRSLRVQGLRQRYFEIAMRKSINFERRAIDLFFR